MGWGKGPPSTVRRHVSTSLAWTGFSFRCEGASVSVRVCVWVGVLYGCVCMYCVCVVGVCPVIGRCRHAQPTKRKKARQSSTLGLPAAVSATRAAGKKEPALSPSGRRRHCARRTTPLSTPLRIPVCMYVLCIYTEVPKRAAALRPTYGRSPFPSRPVAAAAVIVFVVVVFLVLITVTDTVIVPAIYRN